MSFDVSILKITSAMARHAAESHATVGQNIARKDVPQATAQRTVAFNEALRDLSRGEKPRTKDTGQAISLSTEMQELAVNAGRHAAATTVWSKTLGMMRMTLGSGGQ